MFSAFKKRILLAGMVAVFAFIVTIGSTYAWFTIGFSSTISGINLNIQSATSLMILMDDDYIYSESEDQAFLDNPTNYVTYLTNAAILSKYVFTNIVLEPVTTEDGISWIKQDLLTSASASDAELTPGQYLEFSVWILSQDKPVDVAVMDFSATADNTNPLQNVIADAVRLSVTGDAGTGLIYGQDKEYNYVYDDLTEINATVKTTLIGLHGEFYGDTYIAGESTNVLLDAPTVLTLAANIPEKVIVRIWIEGWDADCNNNALASIFSISFGFIVKEVL